VALPHSAMRFGEFVSDQIAKSLGRARSAWCVAVMIVFMAFPALLPLLSPDPEAGLPACCRTGGAHHCAMSMHNRAIVQAAQGDQFRSFDLCPYYARRLAAPVSASFHPGTAAAIYAAVVSHPAIRIQTVVLSLVSESRSHQKRGPPFAISC
jgi:hypothetical protein